ncbi:MAG: nuclear transport factor 2 family protein [Solirubrobacterales bacterium]
MTSSANLDLVRSIFTARERGDFSSAEWADQEIEYVFADGPSPGTFTGLAGMAEAMRESLSAWEGFHLHVDEYRELDDERVLVLLHARGRGKRSGLELDALSDQGAQIVHVREGKVTRIVVYFDRDRALADLGLTP